MPELSLTVDVAAPPEQVWAAAMDWDHQHEWMLGTRVRGGHGVGAEVEAVTSLGPLHVTDPMEITLWDPPKRCVVVHHGRVVRGTAAFEVEAKPDGTSTFVWTEWLVLPFGWLGVVAWLLVGPLVATAVRYSLSRFARWVPTRP